MLEVARLHLDSQTILLAQPLFKELEPFWHQIAQSDRQIEREFWRTTSMILCQRGSVVTLFGMDLR